MTRDLEGEATLFAVEYHFGDGCAVTLDVGREGSEKDLLGSDDQQNMLIGDSRQQASHGAVGVGADDALGLGNGPLL